MTSLAVGDVTGYEYDVSGCGDANTFLIEYLFEGF